MTAPLSKNDAIRRTMIMTYSTRRACGNIKMPLYAHLAVYMRSGVISTSYQRRARWNDAMFVARHYTTLVVVAGRVGGWALCVWWWWRRWCVWGMGNDGWVAKWLGEWVGVWVGGWVGGCVGKWWWLWRWWWWS